MPADAMLPEAEGLRGPLGCLSEARLRDRLGRVGAAARASRAALEYARTREQFGKPIAGSSSPRRSSWTCAGDAQAQLVALHIGAAEGRRRGHAAAGVVGKRTNVRAALDVARSARSILGANGVTLEYPVIRHMGTSSRC